MRRSGKGGRRNPMAPPPVRMPRAQALALAVLIAWLDLRRKRSGFPRSRALVLFVGASAAIVLSIGLAAVSAIAIHALCILCVMLYLVNVAMAVIAWHAVRHGGESIRQALTAERIHWKRNFEPAFGYSAIALAVLAALFVLFSLSTVENSVICARAQEVRAARWEGYAAEENGSSH